MVSSWSGEGLWGRAEHNGATPRFIFFPESYEKINQSMVTLRGAVTKQTGKSGTLLYFSRKQLFLMFFLQI